MNEILKNNLLKDTSDAKTVEDLKIVVGRLISSLETDEEKKEKFLKSMSDLLIKPNKS